MLTLNPFLKSIVISTGGASFSVEPTSPSVWYVSASVITGNLSVPVTIRVKGADRYAITTSAVTPTDDDAITGVGDEAINTHLECSVFGVAHTFYIWAGNASVWSDPVSVTVTPEDSVGQLISDSFAFDPLLDTKVMLVLFAANEDLAGVWVGQGSAPAWGDPSIDDTGVDVSVTPIGTTSYTHDAYESVSDLVLVAYDASHNAGDPIALRTVIFDQIEYLLTGQADFTELETATMTLSRRRKIALTAYTTGTATIGLTLGGTATRDTHYETTDLDGSDQADFASGEASIPIVLSGIHLPTDYVNRTITAEISSVPANQGTNAQYQASFNLLNADSIPTTPETAQFSAAGSSWNEGDTAQVAFSLSDGIGPATVTLHVPETDYTTAEDTVINVTTEGQTYDITLKSTAGDQGGAVVQVTIDGSGALGQLTHNLSITDTLSDVMDGVPSLDFATEAGPFLYRDTSTSTIYFYIGGASTDYAGRTTFTGTINSTTGFTNFNPISIETPDDTCSQGGNEITLILHSQGTSNDGCSFQVDPDTTTLTITSESDVTLYLGVGKVATALTAGVPYTLIDNGAAPGSISSVAADSVAGTVTITLAESMTAPKPGRGWTFQKPLKALVAP